MATADEQVIVGGQRAVAVRAVEGEYIYDGGATDTQCVVKDGDKAQRATKVVVIGSNGNPLTIDDALSTDSENPVQNKVVTSAINANAEAIETINEELTPWQKPQDWMDIRSGALPNSLYLLVAHSADYSTYPTFSMRVSVSNTDHTYDVFVDGAKVATTANDTETTLNWQTLALTSGYDVTYPSALRTHIVRITPTDPADTVTRYRGEYNNQGTLWAHITAEYAINYFRTFSKNKLLEAVTTPSGELLVKVGYPQICESCSALVEFPVINCTDSGTYYDTKAFTETKLKKITIKNAQISYSSDSFKTANLLQEIKLINSKINFQDSALSACTSLKKFPNIWFSNTHDFIISAPKLTSLENTVLDFTPDNGHLKKVNLAGTSTARVDGLKGLTVSATSLFTGVSPQIDVSYTGMNKSALVSLFNSLPTVTDSQVCNIMGASGAADLTAEDLAIATAKGWTLTR